MMRDEIRRRALRAAAAASLTLGLFGCSGEVRTAEATAGASPGAGGSRGAGSGMGGALEVGGAGGVGNAGVAAPRCDMDSPDYGACCADAGWSLDAGCTPWGPPMPPAMEDVA